MNSRMERYENNEFLNLESRTKKNQNLYSEINNQDLSRVKMAKNYQIIDEHPKEIDIEKIKKYISSLNQAPEERKKISINPQSEDLNSEIEEPKIYDINSIIEEAKSKRETTYEEDRYKKINNTQYDILKKLDLYNKEIEQTEEEFNTNEKTLIDLINTVTMKKEETNLLSELTGGNENTVVMKPVKETEVKIENIPVEEEKSNTQNNSEVNNLSNIDKSFYTNSMNFSKEDFENIGELEKSVNKNNFLVKFSILILLIFVIGTLVIIFNYVFKIGLF